MPAHLAPLVRRVLVVRLVCLACAASREKLVLQGLRAL